MPKKPPANAGEHAQAVRLIIDNAEEAPPPPGPPDDAPADRRSGRGSDDGQAPQLPEGCPVVPLGTKDGINYFLSELGEFREIKQLGRLDILGLFGRRNGLPRVYWPRVNSEGEPTGWRPELAAEALSGAAARKGIWNPFERVRGRGAWLGEDGELILHCGDIVYDGRAWREPGIFGRYVLPAGEPIMRPWDRPVPNGSKGGPASELLALLKTWNWRRRDLDARLVLGWIGASMLGGALKWRPLIWITGGKSTGKSTLQEMIKALFGDALLSIADPSGAGLWQTLKYDTLPAALDEREAENDNRQQNGLVKLARLAASGGVILRGGADHNSEKFMARSCFMFSSIRMPPLLGQDRSRIAICALGELQAVEAPDLSTRRMGPLGRQLLRRLVDGWPRYAQAVGAYRAALLKVGHNNRGVDVFGTLLACADLLLNDHEVDGDSAAELATLLDVAVLPEAEDDASDQQRWLQHLLTHSIPLDGVGARNTVTEWLRRAVTNAPFESEAGEADRILATYGIKVMRPRGQAKPTHFAVANQHTGLERLHAGTHWSGRSGSIGVWVQAARDLPGADVTTQRFGGPAAKGTSIPLELVFPKDEDESQRKTGAQQAFEIERSET